MEAGHDPQAVLLEAVALMRQGRYAESLQKHVWFHDHALEHNPALAGVRLSFALSFWMELGALYPEALQALTTLRDDKAKALAEGQGSLPLFHDVQALNRCLQEEQKTVALFKQLHQTHLELARQCFHAAEASLVAHHEYEVCMAYLPDPFVKLEELRQIRQMQLEIADENSTLGSPEAGLRAYAEMSFADGTCRLIALLVGVGRRQDAERVRELGLAVSDSAEVRAALDEALSQKDTGP